MIAACTCYRIPQCFLEIGTEGLILPERQVRDTYSEEHVFKIQIRRFQEIRRLKTRIIF